MGRLSKIKLELIQEANKRLLGEDVETITPNFKASKGLLDIEGSKYKLQSEKGVSFLKTRIGINIIDVSTSNDGGIILVAEHPVTGKHIKSEIRKSNVDKVIDGAVNNKKEIMVKNLEGQEFYLVRV